MVSETKEDNDALYVILSKAYYDLVKISKDILSFPVSCSTIIISNIDNFLVNKQQNILTYSSLLEKIPSNIIKIIFIFSHTHYYNIDNLLDNLPLHIEEIELNNVFYDNSKILPNLTNLPIGLKKYV